MDTRDVWLNDETLRHLKSLSKKLASPDEHVVLTSEEVDMMQKIRHGRALPAHVVKHFLANGLPI